MINKKTMMAEEEIAGACIESIDFNYLARRKGLASEIKSYGDQRAAKAEAEVLKLRKIASHVPGTVYIKAKEAAGYGVEIKTLTAEADHG